MLCISCSSPSLKPTHKLHVVLTDGPMAQSLVREKTLSSCISASVAETMVTNVVHYCTRVQKQADRKPCGQTEQLPIFDKKPQTHMKENLPATIEYFGYRVNGAFMRSDHIKQKIFRSSGSD